MSTFYSWDFPSWNNEQVAFAVNPDNCLSSSAMCSFSGIGVYSVTTREQLDFLLGKIPYSEVIGHDPSGEIKAYHDDYCSRHASQCRDDSTFYQSTDSYYYLYTNCTDLTNRWSCSDSFYFRPSEISAEYIKRGLDKPVEPLPEKGSLLLTVQETTAGMVMDFTGAVFILATSLFLFVFFIKNFNTIFDFFRNKTPDK